MPHYLTAHKALKCSECKNDILMGQKYRVLNRRPHCLICANFKEMKLDNITYYDYVMARRSWQAQYWNRKLRR